MLDWCGVQFIAKLLHQLFALIAFRTLNPNLDEFMGLQRAMDFSDDGWSQAVGGDGDHRAEMVCPGTQFAPFGRVKFKH